jgi:hypothetical protein
VTDDQIAEMYEIEVGSDPVPLSAFIDELEPEVPAFPYAVSSVERNMFRMGTRAAALRAGLGDEWPRISRVVEAKLRQVPYTRWSGD